MQNKISPIRFCRVSSGLNFKIAVLSAVICFPVSTAVAQHWQVHQATNHQQSDVRQVSGQQDYVHQADGPQHEPPIVNPTAFDSQPGCCPTCGCTEKPKSELRLVRTYRKVETPYYGTDQGQRYYHAKGMASHQRSTVDEFVHRKTDQCGEDCFECETQGGCKTAVGAVVSGTHQSTSFRQPMGVTTQYVSVLKWKKVKHCVNCNEHFIASDKDTEDSKKAAVDTNELPSK